MDNLTFDSTLTFDEARLELRRFREQQVRSSEETVEIWENLLSKYPTSLGDEIWAVLEQVAIASFDAKRIDIANKCISKLAHQFPNSLRVRKLYGMRYEACSRFDDALKIYDDILKEDETNSIVRKRRIAIRKATGDIESAIKELTSYLNTCMSDQEAWMELAELYLNLSEYKKAAFCFDELILANPHNHLYFQQYAEILYTIGGYENLEMARSYFAQAINLNQNNIRAFYGMYLTSTNLANHSKTNAKIKTQNMRYANWAAKHIAAKYQTVYNEESTETENLSYIDSALEMLQITQS